MVSCGVGLSAVGLSEIRKPQVKSYVVQISGFVKCTVRGADCAHFVLNATSFQLIPAHSSQSSSFARTLVFP